MNVATSIGENYRFELHEALLIYQGNGNSFVTRHEIELNKNAPPVLGPAQPLSVTFLEALVQSIGGSVRPEFLPEHVIAKGDRMIAWWTPPRRRAMFYANTEAKAKHLSGKVFPQPPLIWVVREGHLKIRALKENKRPKAETKLAVAPFWNLSHDGGVCTGSMRRPDSATVTSIPSWEQGFYESNFTHSNVGRLTRHKGGFDGLWTPLAGKRAGFPTASLIELPETVLQFLERR